MHKGTEGQQERRASLDLEVDWTAGQEGTGRTDVGRARTKQLTRVPIARMVIHPGMPGLETPGAGGNFLDPLLVQE